MSAAPHAVAALIVTYNSELVAGRAVAALTAGSTPPEVIVVVDNGSRQTGYLDEIAREFSSVRLLKLPKNLGFCAANNRGLPLAGERHLLLVNPDAFVTPTFVHDAVALLDRTPTIGAVGPKLLGADPATGRATGLIDSAGIGQTRWGRLFDRFKGEPDEQHSSEVPMEPAALCAAAMLVRREAVEELTHDRRLFDERFFMYKEDVELSWRLQRAGWRILMDPALTVLHCRGWSDDRRAMPAWARRRSITNEWRLWRNGWAPGRSRWTSLPYLVAKTIAVGAGR